MYSVHIAPGGSRKTRPYLEKALKKASREGLVDAALCAGKADLLIVLTDIDGLYTADPRHEKNAVLIPEVRSITAEMLASAGGHGTALSTGGMATKLSAAKICMEAGTDMIILNGARPNVLYDILDGKSAGTRFIGRKNT